MAKRMDAIGGPKCGCEASCCKGDSYVAKVRKDKKKPDDASSSNGRKSDNKR